MKTVTVLLATLAALATTAGVQAAPPTGTLRFSPLQAVHTTAMSGGIAASSCLHIVDSDAWDMSHLQNDCTFPVEGAWCAEGYDCNRGYGNQHTFESGESYPVQGTGTGNPVREVKWGACRGRNTIVLTAGTLEYDCDPE
jgi:hypothetical protein